MGADGGVVYIPLRNGTDANYKRVTELLQPFWQFLCTNDCSNIGEDANWEWQQANPINAPEYVLGYYGTDRVDNFELGDLRDTCYVPTLDDLPYQGDLYSLTFDELDLECRTSPFPIKGAYYDHPLHRLWHQHFYYSSREEVLSALGPLADMKAEDWANELNSLLYLDRVVHEETWT